MGHTVHYSIDIEKLFNAMDVKRRQSKLSWARLGERMGTHPSTLSNMRRVQYRTGEVRKDLQASVFANVILWLNRPITDFLVENKKELYTDANGS